MTTTAMCWKVSSIFEPGLVQIPNWFLGWHLTTDIIYIYILIDCETHGQLPLSEQYLSARYAFHSRDHCSSRGETIKPIKLLRCRLKTRDSKYPTRWNVPSIPTWLHLSNPTSASSNWHFSARNESLVFSDPGSQVCPSGLCRSVMKFQLGIR